MIAHVAPARLPILFTHTGRDQKDALRRRGPVFRRNPEGEADEMEPDKPYAAAECRYDVGDPVPGGAGVDWRKSAGEEKLRTSKNAERHCQ